MTRIFGTIRDAHLAGLSGRLTVWSGFRPTTTSLIAPKRSHWHIAKGVVPDGVQVAPGPAFVQLDFGASAFRSWPVDIPNAPEVSIQELLFQSLQWEPGTVVPPPPEVADLLRIIADTAEQYRLQVESETATALDAIDDAMRQTREFYDLSKWHSQIAEGHEVAAYAYAEEALARSTEAQNLATQVAADLDEVRGVRDEADQIEDRVGEDADRADDAADRADGSAGDAGDSADQATSIVEETRILNAQVESKLQEATRAVAEGERHVLRATEHADSAVEAADRATDYADQAQGLLDEAGPLMDQARAARDEAVTALADAQSAAGEASDALSTIEGVGTEVDQAQTAILGMHQDVLDSHADVLTKHQDVLDSHSDVLDKHTEAIGAAADAASSAADAAADAATAATEAGKAADEALSAADANSEALAIQQQVTDQLAEATDQAQAAADSAAEAQATFAEQQEQINEDIDQRIILQRAMLEAVREAQAAAQHERHHLLIAPYDEGNSDDYVNIRSGVADLVVDAYGTWVGHMIVHASWNDNSGSSDRIGEYAIPQPDGSRTVTLSRASGGLGRVIARVDYTVAPDVQRSRETEGGNDLASSPIDWGTMKELEYHRFTAPDNGRDYTTRFRIGWNNANFLDRFAHDIRVNGSMVSRYSVINMGPLIGNAYRSRDTIAQGLNLSPGDTVTFHAGTSGSATAIRDSDVEITWIEEAS